MQRYSTTQTAKINPTNGDDEKNAACGEQPKRDITSVSVQLRVKVPLVHKHQTSKAQELGGEIQTETKTFFFAHTSAATTPSTGILLHGKLLDRRHIRDHL